MKDILVINTTLQEVELCGNSFGDEGCRIIIEGLHKNITLVKLTMERKNVKKDELQECIAFIKRNEIIKNHRNNVDSLGIYFYVTMKIVTDRKPYLAWANKDSTTIVNTAAKSVEYFALVIFLEILHSIVDSENRTAQLKLSELTSPTIVKMMRDRKQLRILLN